MTTAADLKEIAASLAATAAEHAKTTASLQKLIDKKGQEVGDAFGRTYAKAAAEQIKDKDRDLQRAAELRYTVKAETRDRFITKTLTEVRYVTQHLVSCPLGAPAVRVLNDAAACAREDRPASCGAGEPVRSPS
mgnify:CR=1 FL=1